MAGTSPLPAQTYLDRVESSLVIRSARNLGGTAPQAELRHHLAHLFVPATRCGHARGYTDRDGVLTRFCVFGLT